MYLYTIYVYNTFTLYKYITGKNLSFPKFHLYLIEQILRKYLADRPTHKSIGGNSNNLPFWLIPTHFPSPYIKIGLIRKNARRKCVVCKKHNKRRETHYQCEKCDLGLCIHPCFEMYHTLLDY